MATRKEIIDIEIKGINDAVKDVDKLESSLKGVDTQVDNISDSSKQLSSNLSNVDKSGKDAGKGLKAVGDNGGAIAVLDSLTGGLATKVRDTAEATKLFNINLKATKTALIATGIGVFVVLLGLVVAFWDDISDAISGVNKKLQAQIDLNKENLETLDFELDLLEAKLKILEAEGKSTVEIRKQKEAILLIQQEQNRLLLINLQIQLQRELAQVKEISFWERLKITAASALNPLQGQLQEIKAGLADKEEQTRLDEITDQIQEATLRTEALKLALIEVNQIEAKEREKIEGKTIGNQLERARNLEQGLLDVTKEFLDKKLEAIQTSEERESEILFAESLKRQGAKAEELLKENRLAKERRRLRAQDLAEEKILQQQKLLIVGQTFGAIADILGTNSKAGKAAAIAQATINTYQGITEVWSSPSALPEPFATISKIASTATVLASGLAAVKQIKSQELPALGGKGTANIASSTAALPATVSAISPSFSIAGATSTNQLADSIGSQSQLPLRAFVVSDDITSAQRIDDNIIESASIG